MEDGQNRRERDEDRQLSQFDVCVSVVWGGERDGGSCVGEYLVGGELGIAV